MFARIFSAALRRTFSRSFNLSPFIQFQDAVALQTWLQTRGVQENQARTMAPPLFSKGYTDSDLLEVAKMEDFERAGLDCRLARMLLAKLEPIHYTLFGSQPFRARVATVGELLASLQTQEKLFPFVVLDPSGEPMWHPESRLNSDKTYAVVYEHNFEKFKARQQEEVKPMNHKTVTMEPVIKKAMEIVRENIDLESDREFRVPPGVIVSCARSGKTTALEGLFNAILKEGKYMPIYVTFNDQSGFERNPKASVVQDFLRAVITQLDPDSVPPERETHTYFSRQRLDDYLKSIGKPVVLLVDELNSLAKKPPEELAALLREVFLDPPGRYLCFTSHRGIDLSEETRSDEDDELGGRGDNKQPSPRGLCSIMVAHTQDAAVLQQMFKKNEKLNPLEVALYCGLPGLVYSMKTSYSYRYHEIFNAARLKPDFLAEHVDAFLKQVLTGGDCCPPELAHFTFRDDKNMFVWPLCYIEAYLAKMGAFGSPLANLGETVARLIAISDRHPLLQSREERKESSSLVWEYTVRIGLALGAFAASRGAQVEKNLFLRGVPSRFQLLILHIPETATIDMKETIDMDKIATAQVWIDQEIEYERATTRDPVVALAFPKHRKFERFDAIIRCSDPEHPFWRASNQAGQRLSRGGLHPGVPWRPCSQRRPREDGWLSS